MGNPKKISIALCEEALRPSRYIGYEHDRMGCHLLECEAYSLAESEFRRAMWLNPYEPSFPAHLAWCLYKQGKITEAQEWIDRVLTLKPDHEEAQHIRTILQNKRKDMSDPT